jgi:hypothetical protein
MEVEHAHAERMADIRAKEAEAEAEHELRIADKEYDKSELEGDIEETNRSYDTLQESLKSLKPTGIKWVDALRGMMRPAITVYLMVVATILTLRIGALVGGLESLNPKALFALYQDVIQQIVFLTATAVTWWFGSRPSSRRK